MASIPVNNNLNMLMNTVSQTAGTAVSKDALFARAEEAVKQSFDTVMNRVSTQAASKLDSTVQAGKTVSSDIVTGTTDSAKNTADRNKTPDTKGSAEAGKEEAAKQTQDEEAVTEAADEQKETVTEAADEQKEVVTEAADEQKEAVTEAADKVVEEVAGELDVSEEEVIAAMEILGLTAVDLLNPENLKMLLVTLSGSEDAMVLLTDSDLYQSLQNLLGTVADITDELQAELGISEEELNALIEEVGEGLKQEAAEDIVVADPTVQDEEPVLEGMQDYTVTVQKDGQTVEIKVSVDDASGDKSTQEEVTAVPKEVHMQESKSGAKDASGEQKGEGNAAGNFLMQTPVLEPQAPEIVQAGPVTEPFVSTEDIMNQILEYMKINVKEGVQELEMQLHPASLGNINVQIAAKDGFITAQFHAQNEVVRAAIESQLIILKEQFEEQGIKVDAVEVTVGNYHAEQSFSEQEEEAKDDKKNGKKQRRINLGALDGEEMPEDMDDSERIAVEMMEQSGNTVDFTA